MDVVTFNRKLIHDHNLLLKYEVVAQSFEHLTKICEESSEIQRNVMLKIYETSIKDLQQLIVFEDTEEFTQVLSCILHNLFTQKLQFEGKLQRIPKQNQDKIKSVVKRRKDDSSSRREAIKLTLMKPIGSGLNDIAGLSHVKSIFNKSFLLPLRFPSLFKGGRKPWNQILLYGPPGTGKSRMVHALACEAKVELYGISSADILSSWVGESEKMIKDLFEYTRNKEDKSIVFIDEIDSLCRQRTNKEGDHTRSIKNQLLIELDQNITYKSNSFIICATNCPWDLDNAFLRRFQCRVHVPLPDVSSRLTIIQNQCKDVNTDLSEDDWKELANRTEGYSGSDLTNLTTFAIQEPLGELVDNTSWIITPDKKWMPTNSLTKGSIEAPLSSVPADKIAVRNVKKKDFIKAILLTPRTVRTSEIEKYKRFS